MAAGERRIDICECGILTKEHGSIKGISSEINWN
jgi:hypothetical protein